MTKRKTKTVPSVDTPEDPSATRRRELAAIKKKVAGLAKKLTKESPVPPGLRRDEMIQQLAQMLSVRDRWMELELLGELRIEKSRQLTRIASEIRKMFDELGITQEPAEESGEDFGDL